MLEEQTKIVNVTGSIYYLGTDQEGNDMYSIIAAWSRKGEIIVFEKGKVRGFPCRRPSAWGSVRSPFGWHV